ncbi:hypothetical protein ABZW03_28670 [Kitasatospora sp. NPDC004799]|uniref:hypothetical protein n=1 Tax=Kitasatospora sp. NPDC004799 TaxID=3154460 RepID=UPI0033BE0B7E
MEAPHEDRPHRPAAPARPARRGHPRLLPGTLALAAAALALGTSGPTPSAAASELCPAGNLCLYTGGIGIPEPLQIRQCRSREFDPPFRARKIENNTPVTARVSTADGATLDVQPRQTVAFAPDLYLTAAGTLC